MKYMPDIKLHRLSGLAATSKIDVDHKNDPDIDINNLSTSQQLSVIKDNPTLISQIDNPHNNIQIKAVQLSPLTFKHIKHPTDECKLLAIRKHRTNINYIKHWTGKLFRTVVETYSYKQLSEFLPKILSNLHPLFDTKNMYFLVAMHPISLYMNYNDIKNEMDSDDFTNLCIFGLMQPIWYGLNSKHKMYDTELSDIFNNLLDLLRSDKVIHEENINQFRELPIKVRKVYDSTATSEDINDIESFRYWYKHFPIDTVETFHKHLLQLIYKNDNRYTTRYEERMNYRRNR